MMILPCWGAVGVEGVVGATGAGGVVSAVGVASGVEGGGVAPAEASSFGASFLGGGKPISWIA